MTVRLPLARPQERSAASTSTAAPGEVPSSPSLLTSAQAADTAATTLLRVGDLARESGKTVRAIHLYEELDLLRPVGRSKGRYRLYGPEALVRIRWIGKLQDMGFSLTDIQTIVRDWEEGPSAPGAMTKMKATYANKLADTRKHIRRLQALEQELKASLAYLETCEVCEPDRLLSTCGSCEHHDCNHDVPELVLGFRAH